MRSLLFTSLLLPALLAVSRPDAATLPAGFTETKLAGGLNPSAMEVAPDGRVFVLDKSGKVLVFKDGIKLAAPFLTLDVDSWEERGLLGMAFHPVFPDSPFVYLYYTAKNPSRNRVSRFRAQGDVAAAGETVLIDLENLTNVGWHNGGAIHFGTDGKLYIASGNNVNNDYSQSINALLGKVLRLNPDGSIPTDNPFYNSATGKNRAIWALGLRNPYTMAVHPVTGRILVNDVGGGAYEEINEGKGGSNYGWPRTEGNGTAPTGITGTYANPVSAYSHNDGCAITGSTFYQPKSNTFGEGYLGMYFFADYCRGWIRAMDPKNANAVKGFATGITRPIDLKTGTDGSLYYLARGARAPGVSEGSANDNTSTADGSLYMVKGSAKPTALVPGGGTRLRLSGVGSDFILVPEGAVRLEAYDLQGKKVWEYGRPKGEGQVRVEIPPGLGRGVLQFRAF